MDGKIFRKQGRILNVPITGTHQDELLIKICGFLSKVGHFEAKKPLFVTTPNPEQVLLAQKDHLLMKILSSSDISLCDGVGLLAAHEYFLKKIPGKSGQSTLSIMSKGILFANSLFSVLQYRKSSDGFEVIKGRKFFLDLLKIAQDRRYRVFLLGSTREVMNNTVIILKNKFPSVQFESEWDISMDENGVPVNKRQKYNEQKIIKKINTYDSDMLFVAFGAPKQEKWVYRHIHNLNTKLVMVVGGSFDYISGTRRPVPIVLEKSGLEWLWRIVSGDQKFERIYNAIIKFPLLVVKMS